jgi:four helix bundle protein
MVTAVDEGRGKREEPPRWQMPQRGFWKLRAWQAADEMASAIYVSSRTRDIPLWLQDQVGKSGLSVPSNIAEGYTRGSINDYLHFLDIARSSLAESEYQVYFLHKHGHISDRTRDNIASLQYKAHNLLVALIKALREKARQGTWNRLGEEKAEYQTGDEPETDYDVPPSFFHLPGTGEG